MKIEIENGGILTTIQDGGRFGYEQFGVSPGGPMDYHAMQIANLLVDNNKTETCLEMTIMGPTLRFRSSAVIAITGADMKAMLNDKPVSRYRAVMVCAGDILRFGMAEEGCRTYLAVAGGFLIPEVMGSKGTMVAHGFGGYQGRKLAKGDALILAKKVESLPNMPSRWTTIDRYHREEKILRVIMGPQDDRFSEKGIQSFLKGTYEVTSEFDRMGYRLKGPVIEHKEDGNIISDGIVTGSIQVPTDGQPIVMLSEHQTIGGYTKIATIITIDLPVIGQCKAKDKIRFQKVSLEEAHRLYRAYEAEVQALIQKIKTPVTYLPPKYYTITIHKKTYQVQVEERKD